MALVTSTVITRMRSHRVAREVHHPPARGERGAGDALAREAQVLALAQGREALGGGGAHALEELLDLGGGRREVLAVGGLERIERVAAHELVEVLGEGGGGIEELEADYLAVDRCDGAALAGLGAEGLR